MYVSEHIACAEACHRQASVCAAKQAWPKAALACNYYDVTPGSCIVHSQIIHTVYDQIDAALE